MAAIFGFRARDLSPQIQRMGIKCLNPILYCTFGFKSDLAQEKYKITLK